MPEWKTETIGPHVFTHEHEGRNCRCLKLCKICGLDYRSCTETFRPARACNVFTGKREWGLNPEPWRLCIACGHSKAQHEVAKAEPVGPMDANWLVGKIAEERQNRLDAMRSGDVAKGEYHRGALEALTHVLTRLVDGQGI